MASTSEIRRRISSVQETQKITHAMYLISSAKMRKARAELDEVRPYFDVLNHEITRVFTVDETVDSRYFTAYGNDSEYGEGTLGCLVITADKGLAGAYNHNVLKEAQRIYEEHPDTEFFVIGEYGRRWFTQKKLPMADSFRYTAQNPSTYRAQHRGGKGVKCYKITEKTGYVIGVKAVTDENEIMMITTEGIIIQIRMDDVSQLGRITSGVKLINLDAGVTVAQIAKVREKVSDGNQEFDDVDDGMEDVSKPSEVDQEEDDDPAEEHITMPEETEEDE